MFLSIRHMPMRRKALITEVIDLDTGEKIPRVLWANDETGRYRQQLIGKSCSLKSKIFKGNIKLRVKEIG